MAAGTVSSSEAADGRVGSSSAARVKAARPALGAGACGRSVGELGKAAGVAAVCESGVVVVGEASGAWVEGLQRADLLTGFIVMDGS